GFLFLTDDGTDENPRQGSTKRPAVLDRRRRVIHYLQEPATTLLPNSGRSFSCSISVMDWRKLLR
ncbi:hypothetical protein, partial [Dickeya dadantii]|uniref:hypothetical protein n=1 Tax=Dickeya dadantii TaxID=204038 RepID=UPI001C130A5A